MVAKNDKPADQATNSEALDDSEIKSDDRKVCGIVMPIAAMGDDYSEAHWGRVRRVLQRAIDRAGLRSQLVWENTESDVIQTAILQNLFENDIVICDVSNLNPNVMLETGLRLATKRPVIIVTDRVKRPPFDIGMIAYLEYPRDLEYNATEDFISKLSKKIKDFVKAVDEEIYKPYLENFRFETVQPSSVTVTTDQYVRERLDDLTLSISRLVKHQDQDIAGKSQNFKFGTKFTSSKARGALVGSINGDFDRSHADSAEIRINEIPNVYCIVLAQSDTNFEFRIYAHIGGNMPDDFTSIMRKCADIIVSEESRYVLD